ncbi:MAG: dUTP diphosphatase [Spirochaetaceae bacterium]
MNEEYTLRETSRGLGIPCECPPDLTPVYSSADAAGADLKAAVDAPVSIPPGGRALIPTGVRLAIPRGYEGQIRPRSGLAVHHGVTLLNAPGTIDSDYRGEIRLIVINLGDEAFVVQRGERIGQIVIAPVIRAEFEPGHLSDSARGSGGFGSTGR